MLLLLLGTLLAPSAWSAGAPPQSIRELIVLGLEHNIGLRIRKIDVPAAAEGIEFAAAAFDPELFSTLKLSETSNPYATTFSSSDSATSRSLAGELGLGQRFSPGTSATLVLSTERTTGNDIFNDLSPSYRTALVLDLTQPLLRDAGSQANLTPLTLAQNSSRQARLATFLAAQSLALGIADLAYQVSAAERIVVLRQEAVQLAAQTHQANRKRFDLGVIPVSEVQQAETALADRELRLSLARQNRELLFEELNRQVNQQLPETLGPWALAASEGLTPAGLPEPAALFAEARQKRLDLQLSEVDQQSAAVQRDFYRNQLRPRLDLQFQAGLNGLAGEPRDPATTSRFQGNWFNSTGSLLEEDGYQWAVGLQFRLPLGNRQAKASWQQAKLEEQRIRLRQRDLEAQLQTELTQQLTGLKRSFEQLEIAGKFESLAQLSLEQEQRRLEEGLSDTFRILSFQDKMIDARIGRIEAAAQYRRQLVRMDFVRGTIFERFEIAVKIDPEKVDHEKI
jgi:outer membrane protein TolC